VEIRDDVIEECNKHGGVLHVYVDKASPQGNVYVKCPSIATAVAAVNSLHGRWFAGKFRCGSCSVHRICRVFKEYMTKTMNGTNAIEERLLLKLRDFTVLYYIIVVAVVGHENT
jgi:hypothetical protein